MDEFRADLHCHTTFSDGSLTPTEIIHLAKQIGLSGLSITDHDSIDAYPEAILEAKKVNIPLISGIEFSAMLKDTSVHILGYSFVLNHSAIKQLCSKHQLRRDDRNKSIIKLLTAHGMPITEEEVIACAPAYLGAKRIIGRPHIAMCLVNKGYIPNVQEAFRQLIGEGKPCFDRGEPISVEETISVIHEANGFAIIAHPHLIKGESIIPKLIDSGFDGIEGYYSLIPSNQHHRWLKIAKNRNWIVTGGSDFHGNVKPNIPLGCSWVREDTFKFLEERFFQNNSSF